MEIERQPLPTRVILENARPWGRWSGRIAWMIAGLSLLAALGSFGAFSQYFQRDARVLEKWHSLSKTARSKVAIVSLKGAILGGDGFARAQLDHVAEDDDVKAIVLRVDSPGGTASAGSQKTATCRSSSAWGASRPAAAITSPWPTGAPTTWCSPSPPPSPARSASSSRTSTCRSSSNGST
jgi:hypothetical protein